MAAFTVAVPNLLGFCLRDHQMSSIYEILMRRRMPASRSVLA